MIFNSNDGSPAIALANNQNTDKSIAFKIYLHEAKDAGGSVLLDKSFWLASSSSMHFSSYGKVIVGLELNVAAKAYKAYQSGVNEEYEGRMRFFQIDTNSGDDSSLEFDHQ